MRGQRFSQRKPRTFGFPGQPEVLAMRHLISRSIPFVILSAAPFAFAEQSFEVFPADINLKFLRDRQSIVCRFTEPNGVNRNVTEEAKFSFTDATKAKFENGTVLPLADGETKLRVEYNGQTVEVPVKVEAIKEDPAISYRNDVMPVFMRNGCNSGGCHGKASGQNGFKLSVFGFDPEADRAALLKEGRGRRVQPSSPERSLILLKPKANWSRAS